MADTRPNVVFVLAGNVGSGDWSRYGGGTPTAPTVGPYASGAQHDTCVVSGRGVLTEITAASVNPGCWGDWKTMAAAAGQATARDETTGSRRTGRARLRDVSLRLEHDTAVNKALALEVGERLLLAIERSQWDQAEALAAQAATVLRRLVTGQGARAGAMPSLTRAELRLLPLLATRLSFPKIGAELSLSPNTVKSQAISVYRKLRVSSRGDAVTRAKQLGFLDDDMWQRNDNNLYGSMIVDGRQPSNQLSLPYRCARRRSGVKMAAGAAHDVVVI